MMKLALTLLCLTLCSAMATPFYGSIAKENTLLPSNNPIDQEQPPFNDAFYQEDLPLNDDIPQNEQESNTDQDIGQDDEEEEPTAVMQYNPRGDLKC